MRIDAERLKDKQMIKGDASFDLDQWNADGVSEGKIIPFQWWVRKIENTTKIYSDEKNWVFLLLLRLKFLNLAALGHNTWFVKGTAFLVPFRAR